MSNSKLIIGLVAVVIIAIGAYVLFGRGDAKLFGAPDCGANTCLTSLYISGNTYFGSNGTAIAQVVNGTCNLQTSGSFAASSSQQFMCAVTGVSSGDRVFVSLPVGAGTNGSGAGSLFNGFDVSSAYATTTGVIGVTLQNNTGASTSTYPQATTSVAYLVFH